MSHDGAAVRTTKVPSRSVYYLCKIVLTEPAGAGNYSFVQRLRRQIPVATTQRSTWEASRRLGRFGRSVLDADLRQL